MDTDEELEKYKSEILAHELALKKRHIRIEVFIIIFSVLTLGGFFVLLYFLRDALTTGLVVGQREANLYGSMVFVVFLVVWGFLLLQWFIVHKSQENVG